MRRRREKARMKFKKGKKAPWRGFKKRTREAEPEVDKLPEHEEGEVLFKFPKRRKEREVLVNHEVIWALRAGKAPEQL